MNKLDSGRTFVVSLLEERKLDRKALADPKRKIKEVAGRIILASLVFCLVALVLELFALCFET